MPGIEKPGREFCERPRLKLGCSASVVVVVDDDDDDDDRTQREEYVGNVFISSLGTPFSSVHGSTHFLQMTKLQYLNSSTTIELQIKKR